ncbi:hypothetical protein Ctob_008158 [Chrysochromulina tobinii]|uniref:Uncharacterized protein n=1 Tax=Chrysochromulina tobinii TaxID=1460289 RepID=A0A0M0K1V5_9EUKA|nr:hypothetical protein Ctob_008158 [Chrysochromulina tobinii]|eukprot:KOO32557.1 hypothetical protein Ctob_008158 [Chrysochromulina sp. CCMP291]
MESLIHERVGAQFRSSSAPRTGTSSAPVTPKGGSGSSASLGGRPGSASPKARKLTKEAELEFLRRQQRYGWAPDRSSTLSGVEQLKKHLEAAEKKALEATTKVKIKRYQTKAELEEATKAMFERAKNSRAKLDAFVEKKHEEERQQYTATCKKLSISARRPKASSQPGSAREKH